MKHLKTYEKAKEEIQILQNYIQLIDNYEVKDIDTWIIKNYAITNSIVNVIRNSNDPLLNLNNNHVTRDQILKILNQKPMDELHKIVHKGYKKKIKRNY